LDLQPTNLGFL